METVIQKVNDAIKMRCAFVMMNIFVFIGCASQTLTNVDEVRIGYELINWHYRVEKESSIKEFLFIETFNPKIGETSDIECFSCFYKNNYMDIVPCDIDSLLSELQVSELNQKYSKIQSVKLNEKLLENRNMIIYESSNTDGRIVKKITFPIIVKTKYTIYAVFLEKSSAGGRIFLYKKEKGDWVVICSSTLYLV